METPVPGPVRVGGYVPADVDHVIGGDGRVNKNQRIREEVPMVQRHWDKRRPASGPETGQQRGWLTGYWLTGYWLTGLPLSAGLDRLNSGHSAELHWLTGQREPGQWWC